MRIFRSKLKRKSSNKGSGLILVIVAVAFIGILVGSLLTAVSYAYRLKLYDYNAKDNFYYIEQAMDEVYAGVGNDSLTCMQDAYNTVINSMVEYSMTTKSYVTKEKEKLNEEFLELFLSNVNSQLLFTEADGDTLDNYLRSFISNSDVTLVDGKAKVIKYACKIVDLENDSRTERTLSAEESLAADEVFSRIVIKNVTLSRTAKYARSQANGDFTQTISTDIEISQPKFTMNFNSINFDYSTLFDYVMLADNGIEITQNQQEIGISGNIYAAADFYDKGYNHYLAGTENSDVRDSSFYYSTAGEAGYNTLGRLVGGNGEIFSRVDLDDDKVSYTIPSVVQKTTTTDTGKKTTFYNNFENGPVNQLSLVDRAETELKYGLSNMRVRMNDRVYEYYDGTSETSKHSGLYIKGAKVNIQAAELIVPGTIAVIGRNSSLSLYGRTGYKVGEADVWADNIVLDYFDDQTTVAAEAPKMLARANLHVRDDLELNADASSFQLTGRYYGFGNSTKSDARLYVPTVNEDAFYYTSSTVGENGEVQTGKVARGHHNSSAIVINGQNARLDLTEVDALYLAGRTYVELSKELDPEKGQRERVVEEGEIVQGESTTTPKGGKTYIYDGDVNDFKTGESVSVKTNQLAYVPLNITGVTTENVVPVYLDNDKTKPILYYNMPLPLEVQEAIPFKEVLGRGITDGLQYVPVIRFDTTDGTEYYYDFKTIYNLYYASEDPNYTFEYMYKESPSQSVRLVTNTMHIYSADDLAKEFILAYYTLLSNYAPDYLDAKACLKNIGGNFDNFKFDEGYVRVPTQATNVYSSGAITAKSGTSFIIDAEENVEQALLGADAISGETPERDKMLESTTTQMANVSAMQNSTAIKAAAIAEDMEQRYAYVKWTLKNYNKNNTSEVAEMAYVDNIYGRSTGSTGPGEGYLTPINRYLNFNHIETSTDISPSNLQLGSGYQVWVSSGNITISAPAGSDGVVQGIVIARGNVMFDRSVSRFEGLIVSGDKIFVDNFGTSMTNNRTITSLNSSPEVVRAILNECLTIGRDDTRFSYAQRMLKIFKTYEDANYEEYVISVDTDTKTIDTIKYSDVVQYTNWMKNVVDIKEVEDGGEGSDH